MPSTSYQNSGQPAVRQEPNQYASPNVHPRSAAHPPPEATHRQSHNLGSISAPTMAVPSSFVAITALTWVSFVRSKHLDTISDADDVYLLFFFDCRGRRGIDPQVSDNYFGTCITGFLVKATTSELLAEDGVAVAAAALQGEVRRAAENPVSGWNWLDLFSWLPQDRLVNVSGSTRFPAYEVADFGWGAPSRTELVSVNNGQVVLIAAKGGCGGVQASVCMHPDHMDAFNAHFLNCLVD